MFPEADAQTQSSVPEPHVHASGKRQRSLIERLAPLVEKEIFKASGKMTQRKGSLLRVENSASTTAGVTKVRSNLKEMMESDIVSHPQINSAATSQSRPGDLSSKLAATIRTLQGSVFSPERMLSRMWILPTTLRYFQSIIVADGIMQYGGLLAVDKSDNTRWRVRNEQKAVSGRLAPLFKSADAVKSRLLNLAQAIAENDTVP